MSISEAQLRANRENAKKSTGPTSISGRQAVRLNSLTHGFSGHTVVIADHEMEAFARHLENFRAEYKPAGITEEVMVKSLADLSWATSQMSAQSTTIMTLLSSKPCTIPGAPEGEISYAISQAQNLESQIKTLNLLGIYEQRKTRLFNSTRRELAEIQATRKAKEQEEMTLAAALRKNDLETRQPDQPAWDPKENGFVYSIAQIDDFLTQGKRLDRLKKVAA
jgi:hypothetical protein